MRALDAIAALVARDLTAFRRSRSQFYSSVLFPLMLLAVLGAGVSDGLDPRNIDDYATFLTPGMVVMTALFSSTFSSASFYQDRDSGMLNVLYASPHSPRVILLGKMLSAVIIGVGQALLVLLVAAFIPAIDFEWQYGVIAGVLLAAFAVVLLNLLLSGLGQVLAARIRTIQGFHLVMNLVLFPFLFFSGAFFPLDGLPLWLEALGIANPLSYAVDMLQLALYAEDSSRHFGLAIDFAVLVILAAGLVAAGAGRQIEPER